MPRNPKLVEWMKLMRDPDGVAYVQVISEGTRQMMKEMTTLGLPAPWYRLSESETLIKLENNSDAREAAFLAASQSNATEFGNLFLLRGRRGQKPLQDSSLTKRYTEVVTTLRDVLAAKGWFIDKAGFSRIIAHRRGSELPIPQHVKPFLRFYSAYEFQIRQYFDNLYLCLDYRCQVLNVQKLGVIAHQIAASDLINKRCIASHPTWREGKIIDFSTDVATVRFFDSSTEEQVPVDSVIPHCTLSMLEDVLRYANISFDLAAAVKLHSLASTTGASRERSERIKAMVIHLADSLFPIQLSDIEVSLSIEPLGLTEESRLTSNKFQVHRLAEPTVEFREHHSSSDVRSGITQFGAYDNDPHDIEIVPVCLNSAGVTWKNCWND